MDLRVERTRKSIAAAFLELRAKRSIEKISVKEIAELAMINKATFYLHYRDVYDLSDKLEDEVLEACLADLPVDQLFTDEGYRILSACFMKHTERFSVLFSGSRIDHAVHKLDQRIKEKIFADKPAWRNDLAINIKLTMATYGGFHAYFKYQTENHDTVISALAESSMSLLGAAGGVDEARGRHVTCN